MMRCEDDLSMMSLRDMDDEPNKESQEVGADDSCEGEGRGMVQGNTGHAQMIEDDNHQSNENPMLS